MIPMEIKANVKTLPRGAQSYIVFVWALGVLTVSYVFRYQNYGLFNARWWEFALLCFTGIYLGQKKIHLFPTDKREENSAISIVMIAAFAALVRLGPLGMTLICMIGCISSCWSQPNFQKLFNLSLTLVESGISGILYVGVSRVVRSDADINFVALGVAALVYYLINSFGVSTVIALVKKSTPIEVWRQNFAWMASSYFAAASMGALPVMLFRKDIGAMLFFVVPIGFFTFQHFSTYQARAKERTEHLAAIEKQQRQLTDTYLAVIQSLALAIDAKDQYTHQHILRVQRYSIAIAEKMGLCGPEMEGLRTGALLHDIGKLGVPEYVLLKPGKLTAEEFEKIKKHPEIGAAILDPVEFPWPVLPVVKYHHEKWNGTGYPEGLKGEEIPLTARILAVADVYDALTSTRSYRNAWTHEKAVELIRRESGTHFYPAAAEAFLEIIDGVVEAMAAEGHGPLVPRPEIAPAVTKADQAARDIHRASSELWALYEVAQTLSASMGIEETINILARKLEAILPGTACLFLLKTEEEGVLVARAAVGLNRDHFLNSQTLGPSSRSLAVMREGETFYGEYEHDDLMLTAAQSGPWFPLHSAMIVPIIHQGEALGTINLYHSQPHAFTPHDQHLLEMIAERAALALYNGLLYDRARSHAFTDPLTDLYNLRFLTQYVEKRSSEEYGNAFAVLCLDLDSFRPVNDNFGHQRGDQVLCELAQLLRGCVGQNDVVARYGGDEFLIVLEGASGEAAHETAAAIQEAIRLYDPGLVHHRLGALRIGVSVGYACFPEDGLDCTSLISIADARMYENKTDRKLEQMASQNRAAQRRIAA